MKHIYFQLVNHKILLKSNKVQQNLDKYDHISGYTEKQDIN